MREKLFPCFSHCLLINPHTVQQGVHWRCCFTCHRWVYWIWRATADVPRWRQSSGHWAVEGQVWIPSTGSYWRRSDGPGSLSSRSMSLYIISYRTFVVRLLPIEHTCIPIVTSSALDTVCTVHANYAVITVVKLNYWKVGGGTLHFSTLHFPPLLSLSFPPILPLEVGPLNPLRESGGALPSRVWGRAPVKGIWCF